MPALSLRLFDAASDAEAARYRILAGLAETHDAFRANEVSPWLDELVELHRALAALVSGAASLDGRAGAVVDVDWEAGRLVRETPEAPLALELARWALPRVEAAIGEGRTLYEFAAERAELRAVGIVPSYRDEGFLLVRDGAAVCVLRYHVSPLSGPDGHYRALRTARLDADLDPLAPPSEWKTALASPELPTPAAFCLDAEVDLPVVPTLVPVAKRKLLGLVGSWGEA
ncbi:hypothetical protein [Rubrivirga marina]|uniref:Uncharacterized protein n=1 Tax=Rubrivirga marina TaxID=1196024 RepID=A0A271J4V2_9BACT|nr:hypothetical protein [Rubrivirga marina]PAP78463.1 hypothetical protein BSZ37_19545 [Rubrivirga marina]